MSATANDGAVLRSLGGGAWARKLNWRKLNWPSCVPLTTSWDGVIEVVNGRVTKLFLSDMGLTGTIPKELGQLQQLQQLNLACNELSGPIPPQLGNLSHLVALILGCNRLEGPIPPELGNLNNLELLLLHDNQLTGPIPPQLGNLSHLTNIYLHDNQFNGPIPPQLRNLSNLTHLYLSENQLNGNIPKEGELGSLLNLVLKQNRLSGSISKEGELGNLTHLVLKQNRLSGPIPPELGNLKKLELLDLSLNQFSGPIPPQLGNLSHLTHLYLSENQLNGPIPPELGNLNNLELLLLHDNQLTDDPGCLGSREAVARWQQTLLSRRKAEEGTPFFTALCTFQNDHHPVVLLEWLCPLITCVPELQLYFTLCCASWRHGLLNKHHRNDYIRRGLEAAAETVPTSSSNIAVFKLALDEAKDLGAIDQRQYYTLDNKAEVRRMEHASFVTNMQECIQANALAIQRLQMRVDAHGAAIDYLGRRVDAHDSAIMATYNGLMDFRAAYQKKLKAQATVGMLKNVVNALALAAGCQTVDTYFFSTINDTVDFSDFSVVQHLCLDVGFNAQQFLENLTPDEAEQALFGILDSQAAKVGDEVLDAATRGQIAIKILGVAAASCSSGDGDTDLLDLHQAPWEEQAPNPGPPPLPPRSAPGPPPGPMPPGDLAGVLARARLGHSEGQLAKEEQAPNPSPPPLPPRSAPGPPPGPMPPRDLAEALARARLGHLEEQLAKAGFTTLDTLKELAEFGREEFLNVTKEDICVQKIGERLGLWSMAKAATLSA